MYTTTTNNKQRVCVVNGYVRMIDAMHKKALFLNLVSPSSLLTYQQHLGVRKEYKQSTTFHRITTHKRE